MAKTSRGRCIHRCSMLHPVLFIRHCAGYKQLYIRQKSLPSFLSPSDLLSSPFCSLLFEQSEFLTATSQKKNLCVCSTNLGFSVGYVLCTRYVCTTLAVVLLIVQLYRYLFIRQWVVVRMIPTFRPRNSCIAICFFVSGWWYHTNVPPVDAHV